MPGSETPESGVGQVDLDATTLTDVYTSTRKQKTVYLKTIIVCNRGAAGTFRIAHAVAGAADSLEQYHYYDQAIAANTSLQIEYFQGVPLSQNDIVRAFASHGDFSVNVYTSVKP